MTTGQKLRILRGRKSFSQVELVEALNMRFPNIWFTRDQYARWENDYNYPSIEAAKALVRYYNITLDDLFFDDRTAGFRARRMTENGRRR